MRAPPPRHAIAARAVHREVRLPEHLAAPLRAGLLDREALAGRRLADREHADPVAREVLRGEGELETVAAVRLEDPVADVAGLAAVALDAGLLARGAGGCHGEGGEEREQKAPAHHVQFA